MSKKEKEDHEKWGEDCPQCGTKWTKTQRNIGGFWVHCLPCKKKAEDIPPKFSYKNSDSKQLDMFEELQLDEDFWDDESWKVF